MANVLAAARAVWNPIRFALFGAIGCALGALAGELLYGSIPALPPPEPVREPQMLCYLIDESGSMNDLGKIDEVKRAAIESAGRQDLKVDRLAVVSFGDGAQVRAPLTDDRAKVEAAIGRLGSNGGTDMQSGLKAARELLPPSLGPHRVILLFTDGMPDSEPLALEQADAARADGIKVVAMTTADAKQDYLRKLAGDPSQVVPANVGHLEESFKKAEDIIGVPVITRGGGRDEKYSPMNATLLLGGTTALLALGCGLALIVGQNWAMKKRPLITIRQAGLGAGGCLAAGAVGGAAGQILFAWAGMMGWLKGVDWLPEPAKVVAWAILGLLVGGGMSLVISNLKRTRAMVAGAIGGAVASFAFVFLAGPSPAPALVPPPMPAVAAPAPAAGSSNEPVARLAGAAVLGGCLGLMIFLVSNIIEACLIVHWSPSDKARVPIGARPILIGSSPEADIYMPKEKGYAPEMATVRLDRGQIIFEDKKKNTSVTLVDGKKLIIGVITIEVKSSIK